MRWLAKAAVQGSIGALPRSREINYVFQTRVSKRLPQPPEEFDQHATAAASHLAALDAVRPQTDRSRLRCYEFGAGWDLAGPLLMWSLGIDHQNVIDLHHHVRIELVNHTLAQFAARHAHVEQIVGAPLRMVDARPITDVAELQARCGITYRAPADARATSFADGSFDFISSTFTLEHIPAAEIGAILRESRRILAPDGLFSSMIDMQDHYSYIDDDVSVYNYLKYPAPIWRWLNPSLQWQSRLRHSEYLRLFDDSGWDVISDEPELPSVEDLRIISALRLAPEFRRFETLDLATRSSHTVARPRPTI